MKTSTVLESRSKSCAYMCSVSSARDMTLSLVVHQIRKHAEFMAGQLDGIPTDGDARVAHIKHKRTAPKFGLGEATGAADERSNARQELFHPERLRDVVVRAAVDSLHFLVPTAARGQNENRGQNACRPASAEAR